MKNQWHSVARQPGKSLASIKLTVADKSMITLINFILNLCIGKPLFLHKEKRPTALHVRKITG